MIHNNPGPVTERPALEERKGEPPDPETRTCRNDRQIDIPDVVEVFKMGLSFLPDTGLAMTGFGLFFVFRKRRTVAEIHKPARHSDAAIFLLPIVGQPTKIWARE